MFNMTIAVEQITSRPETREHEMITGEQSSGDRHPSQNKCRPL